MGPVMARRPVRGADFLQLRATSVGPRGLTDWLAGALRTAISDGRLSPGSRLPSTRALAEDLAVSRGVVVEAYQRLTDEGLVEGRTGRGTTVTSLAGSSGSPARRSPAAAGPPAARQPAELDLIPGVPDLAAFPRAAWLRAERTVLEQVSAGDLGYGDPQGSGRLRDELAGWLARTRGIRADADDIVIVTGVAQALALLAQTLRSRGSTTIGVEDPGSRGARDELRYWGLEPVPVAVDGLGLRVPDLVRADVPAVLLTPAHQFPTGVVLAPGRRRALLGWAAAGGLVIEDDYDAEHRYDRAPVPALHASAPDRVAYTGSTSKTLAPGMRLGWLIAPAPMRRDLVEAKYASDLGSPALPQLVLAQLIAGGQLDRHIRLVRARQRLRRDAVLAALREHLPQARVQGVAAGLHLVILLPGLGAGGSNGAAGSNEAEAALVERARLVGVAVQPLSLHRHRPGPPGLVLGYAALAPDRLHEAIRRLATVMPAPGGPTRRPG
jgi:GntR family transcriptional regulator / MocR family aminotransferase